MQHMLQKGHHMRYPGTSAPVFGHKHEVITFKCPFWRAHHALCLSVMHGQAFRHLDAVHGYSCGLVHHTQVWARQLHRRRQESSLRARSMKHKAAAYTVGESYLPMNLACTLRTMYELFRRSESVQQSRRTLFSISWRSCLVNRCSQ
jgi:hypothetical protein